MCLLQIDHLSINFGGLRAVDDFNIQLGKEELVGLIGPNGAGKTTIFNLICGLYRPSQGEISFNGTNIIGRFPNRITSLGIGRTFQNIRLWNELNVLDNIRIAHFSKLDYGVFDALFHTRKLKTGEKRITEDCLNLLRLFDIEQYSDVIVKNLPYGIQRRVEIARALALKPDLLLLDEPAAGMNLSEIGTLMELVQWVREKFNVTIFIIEHQMQIIMGICERIHVLDFGKTIAKGTPQEIQNNAKVIEAYLGEEDV
jgi:branched-chain amino acid transport system ATP-binding protein